MRVIAVVAGITSVLLVVLLYVAVAPTLGTVERLSSSETVDGIDVPTIGTVGDFPDPATRTVVNVTVDGRLVLDGRAIPTLRDLVNELKRRGAVAPGDVVEGSSPLVRRSDVPVVLRVDGRVPWGVCESLFDACDRARIRLVSFAVRHEDTGGEGALCTPVPGRRRTASGMQLYPIASIVDVSSDERVSPVVLYAELVASWAAVRSRQEVFLRIDGHASTSLAFGMMDAAMRAGATDVQVCTRLLPRTTESEPFATQVASLRSGAAKFPFCIDGFEIGPDSPRDPMPRTPRAHCLIDVPWFDLDWDDRSSVRALPEEGPK